MFSVEAAHRTDRGDRDHNEDVAAVLEEGRVCLVADGMGGAAGGEVASEIATHTVQKAIDDGLLTSSLVDESLDGVLKWIIGEANRRIVEASRDSGEISGMGTTLTIAVIGDSSVAFAHVGDSRLYHWRDGCGQQLTEDHTRTQELLKERLLSPDQAGSFRYSNTLVRYLGTVREVEPQIGSHPLRAGDRLLICSDGLYNPVEPKRLWEILGDGRPAEAAERLVSAAKTCPDAKLDNVTALVVSMNEKARGFSR